MPDRVSTLPTPQPRPLSPRTRGFWLTLLAVTALAAGLRLHKLDHGSFWLDELFSVRACQSLVNGEWQWTKVLGYVPTTIGILADGVPLSSLDPENPSEWRAAGITEWGVRFPTALLGIASIPLLCLASRRILGDRAALLLALFLAVSPWHVYWSQAARFYIPQFLFYNLALILYLDATRTDSRPRLALAALAGVAAYSSQPTAAILAIILAADWVAAFLRRDPIRFGLSGWAILFAGGAACVGAVVADHVKGRGTLVKAVTEDLLATPFGVLSASIYLISPAMAAFAILAGLSLLRADRRVGLFLLIAAFFPILLFSAMAAVAPVSSRYAFVAAFAWTVLAAIGADRAWAALHHRHGIPLAVAPGAAIAIACITANLAMFRSGGNYHARWRDGAHAVLERRAPGEPVHALTPYLASYYLGEPALPLPESVEAAAAIPHTAWLLVEQRREEGPSRRYWLLPHAELIDYFNLRAAHTASSIQVYRHTPDRVPKPPEAPSAAE